ncbi:MAG: peptide chain release factor N(5)-glutamine methyltransferase [Lentisphaeria bacterium]|nr:peptide chain release factor N(5)-glutamine methyltransferase [Lentisphaeria bacterium]
MRVKLAEKELKRHLEACDIPAVEAAWILQDALAVSVTDYAMMGMTELSKADMAKVRSLVERRLSGEPLQYVLGNTEFYGRRFLVGPGALIPRPETETLVELALSFPRPCDHVCDLCAGSGVIALTIASELSPDAKVYGTDLSPEALLWAAKNRALLGCSNVEFFQGDLFAPLPPRLTFGLVVSNPPYVSAAEYAALPSEVRDYEPELALRAAEDGLALLKRIAREARDRLSPGGWLICEMGETHGDRMRAVLTSLGYEHVQVRCDLTGRERFVSGRQAAF